MNIDLMTFFAQIINLIVLAFLLKKFLYKPILRIVEERQNEIVKQLNDAKKTQKQSEAEYKTYLDKIQIFENEKKLLWQECYQELEKEKQKQKNFLLKKRQLALEELQKELDAERNKLETELSLIIARNFLELSEKILKDLSVASPVELIVQGLKKQITGLSQKEIFVLKNELKKEKSIKIVSYTLLTETQVKEIEICLRKTLGVRISFNTEVIENTDLLMGLEIYIGTKMIDWNLKTYLDAFEEDIHARLSNLIIQKEEG